MPVHENSLKNLKRTGRPKGALGKKNKLLQKKDIDDLKEVKDQVIEKSQSSGLSKDDIVEIIKQETIKESGITKNQKPPKVMPDSNIKPKEIEIRRKFTFKEFLFGFDQD